MAKAGKSIPSETEEGAKPKSKKPLFIIIAVLVLGGAGGAGWFFTKGDKHAEEVKVGPAAEPKFVALEPFTVNLQQDGGEKFLQIGITLKFTEPELEEKIKLHMPEIRSRLLLLLSGKHAEELLPAQGKRILAQEIVAEASAALGLPVPKPMASEMDVSAVAAAPAAESAPATSAPATAQDTLAAAAASAEAAAPTEHANEAHLDVLFTSFIIQ